MDAIAAVMFEPVGCLAEFRAEEFERAARELFASTDAAASGSQAYWRLLGLLDRAPADRAKKVHARLEELELAAVEHADGYEDVAPALEKLKSTGVRAYLVTSLSRQAVIRFSERFALNKFFAGSVARDEARGVMAQPLRKALAVAQLDPRQVYLIDTAEALDMAKPLGLNTLLMINDYDEGRALAERTPAGGIVSLAELADALLLIEQRARLRSAPHLPHAPFELFEPG
jgi:phosphoglycolate phosphatase-like HAD superfamily hydrolase